MSVRVPGLQGQISWRQRWSNASQGAAGEIGATALKSEPPVGGQQSPHLYRLMTTRPLPRERLAPGVESGAAAPLLGAVGGDLNRARAVWGMAHGLVLLELDGRLPADADFDIVWQVGMAAFQAIEGTEV